MASAAEAALAVEKAYREERKGLPPHQWEAFRARLNQKCRCGLTIETTKPLCAGCRWSIETSIAGANG